MNLLARATLAALTFSLFAVPLAKAVGPTLAQRLGYKATDKLLIINGDDTGMCHAANVAAIDSLGMGVMDKVVLRFDEAFWDPDVDLVAYTADRSGYFVEWYNAVPWTGAPILVGFNAGRTAQELSGWSDDEILESALGTLDRMFP